MVFVSIVMLTFVGGIAYLGVILVERRVLHYLPSRRIGGNIVTRQPLISNRLSFGKCSSVPVRASRFGLILPSMTNTAFAERAFRDPRF